MSVNRKTKWSSEKTFELVNNLLMAGVVVVMLYPLLNQVAISFSSNEAIMAGWVTVLPKGFNLKAYESVIKDRQFIRSFKNTVLLTLAQTVISLIFTLLFAYPLSKKRLKGRNFIMSMLVFSMMFGTGGLIPNYMVIKNLGLINSYWSLILPGTIGIWYTIVFKNFFQQLPESLEEAARVDGAGVFTVFSVIVLPLSKPVIAAIGLFIAVGAWSTFFNALIYITDPNKKLLQVYLNSVLQAVNRPLSDEQQAMAGTIQSVSNVINSDAVKAACLICTILPIMAVYPFLQKYFVSGLMVGSVKG